MPDIASHADEGFDSLYGQIREVLSAARERAWRAINHEMVRCYWEIGRLIVEEEQAGQERAEYGAEILKILSRRLKEDFGKGFDRTNLQHMRGLYLGYPKCDALRRELSWTHYRILLRVEKVEARTFYEAEAVQSRWSTRELERQIHSLLFERLALSRDQEGLMKLGREGHVIGTPQDLIKDPYVLEFVGLPQSERVLESELETALIGKLQEFLLELGKGFAYMGRQVRITLDGQHYFIDLVFYNRLTRCFVLIDLKAGALTHQDLGQMQMYVNYYQRELTQEGENPPIGIVLCTDKNEAVVRYTLPEGNKQIFASRYKLYLPTEEELVREIQREREIVEREKRLGAGDSES
ncbi:MAG: PDDEXK nuclease domain-containing protein [Candidatus Sumerlaeia bacterium]|nr:PDDEXK nuclease domain-containing protein [Candidatus Sumerlaeia bacterium]